MSTPSPKRVGAAMVKAAEIRASLTDASGKLDVDIEEFLLVVEADTDVMMVLDRLEEVVSMNKDYADRARARIKQLEAREAAGRRVMETILRALDARKVERPTYVASLVKAPSMAVLDDESAIPFDYLVTVPDRKAIYKALKAGEPVEGARLSDPRDILRITRGAAAPDEEISK